MGSTSNLGLQLKSLILGESAQVHGTGTLNLRCTAKRRLNHDEMRRSPQIFSPLGWGLRVPPCRESTLKVQKYTKKLLKTL